jgi:hypothetical protein
MSKKTKMVVAEGTPGAKAETYGTKFGMRTRYVLYQDKAPAAPAAPADPAPPAPPTPQETLDTYIDQAQQNIANTQAQQVAPAPDPMAAIAAAMAEQSAAAQQAAQQQQAALQQLMIQQQTAYQTQMAEAQRQQTEMAARAAESARQTEAMQRAFVPALEPTAAAPMLGDTRTAVTSRGSATNTLSNLAILTGVNGSTSAGATTSLAGLQIA